MVFYQVVDKKTNNLLSFSAAFNESEIRLFDLPFKFADIMSKIPMDNYNRKQRLAISKMLNKSACIGRVLTVVAVPDTPKQAVQFLFDKVQEFALKANLNVSVNCL